MGSTTTDEPHDLDAISRLEKGLRVLRAADHLGVALDGDARTASAELDEERGEGEVGTPGMRAPIDDHRSWPHRLEVILRKLPRGRGLGLEPPQIGSLVTSGFLATT